MSEKVPLSALKRKTKPSFPTTHLSFSNSVWETTVIELKVRNENRLVPKKGLDIDLIVWVGIGVNVDAGGTVFAGVSEGEGDFNGICTEVATGVQLLNDITQKRTIAENFFMAPHLIALILLPPQTTMG
jgi:hypothetical protein